MRMKTQPFANTTKQLSTSVRHISNIQQGVTESGATLASADLGARDLRVGVHEYERMHGAKECYFPCTAFHLVVLTICVVIDDNCHVQIYQDRCWPVLSLVSSEPAKSNSELKKKSKVETRSGYAT